MSNSLLMNLMIEQLLNENPSLKKSLIKEHKDAGVHRAWSPEEITDETEALPFEHKVLSPSELNKVKEPKKGGLVSALKKIGLAAGGAAITLSMLAIANFHDSKSDKSEVTDPSNYNTDHAIHQIAKKDNTLADQIVRELATTSNKDYNFQIIQTIGEDLPDAEDLSKDFIIGNEGTASSPHQDGGQISGGHGTSIFDRGNIKTILNKPDVIKKFKVGKRTTTIEIPFWQNHMYKKYKISDSIALENTQKYPGKIGPEVSRIIFGKKYNEIKNNFIETVDYLYVFPENIQTALLDLAYNMGPYFTKKFKQFDENMRLAAESILNNDFKMANTFLISASDALENNLKEIKTEDKHTVYDKTKTKYFRELTSRAGRVISLLNQGILFHQEVISPPDKRYTIENKKYSLKNIFFS